MRTIPIFTILLFIFTIPLFIGDIFVSETTAQCCDISGKPLTKEPVKTPLFKSTDLVSGKKDWTLQEKSGDVILVHFWSTISEQSLQLLSKYSELHKKYRPQHFTLVAVSLGKDQSEVKKFIEQNKPSYPVILASDQILKSYKKALEGREVKDAPSTILIDRAGYMMVLVDPQMYNEGIKMGMDPQKVMEGQTKNLLMEKYSRSE